MNNCVKIDWFEFTLFVDSVDRALNYLHLTRDEFVDRPGRNGYRSGLHHASGKLDVFYAGNDDMGVHFVFSGSSMDFFFCCLMRSKGRDQQFKLNFRNQYHVFQDWYFDLRQKDILKVSRLDVAFDDYNDCSSVDVVEMWAKGQIRTNWRNFEEISSRRKDGTVTGHTAYFGSRKSEVFLRVYDKKMEQKREDVDFWTRYEFVMKNAYALSFLDGLFQHMEDQLMQYYVGLFKRYFNNMYIIQSFSSCSPYDVGLPSKVDKSIDTVLAWVDRYVAPSLHTLVRYMEGDMTWFYQSIRNALPRRDEEYLLANSTPA